MQGVVKLEFALNQAGETVDLRVVSGHPLLAKAAVDAVRTWRFTLPDGFQAGKPYQTMFEFEFFGATSQLRDNVAETTVESTSFHLVRVMTPIESDTQAEKCPAKQVVAPPAQKLPGDFVELSRSDCFGSCPAYTVRIYRHGEVDWHGTRFVKVRGSRRGQADLAAVDRVLEQFRSERFWSLCGYYSRHVTDSAVVTLAANMGGEEKIVSDYAGSGPAWLRELSRAVDDIANTHRWRHGDSRTEPLSNISMDAWFAKPGVTPLMRAAYRPDLQLVSDLLRGTVDVSDKDSSGWTALMYAAASENDDAVRLLLNAAADPNHASSMGDTPLMAYALKGRFSQDLVRAGGRINQQNKAGVSALMILATRGAPKEIAGALEAGADASLRDAQGRTALDYLHAANCRRSPLTNKLNEYRRRTGGKCDALVEEDFRQSVKILKSATVRRS